MLWVSEFVEASGQASSDIPGMIDLIDEQIRESDAFKNVQEGVDTNLEGISKRWRTMVQLNISTSSMGSAR
jgi:hypothetical protein